MSEGKTKRYIRKKHQRIKEIHKERREDETKNTYSCKKDGKPQKERKT